MGSQRVGHDLATKQKQQGNFNTDFMFNSVQFSRSVVSDSLQSHELPHIKLLYPSPTPELAQTHVHRVGDAIQPSHPLP